MKVQPRAREQTPCPVKIIDPSQFFYHIPEFLWHVQVAISFCFLGTLFLQAPFERNAREERRLGPSRQAAELPWGLISSDFLYCDFIRMDVFATYGPWYTLLEKPTADKIKLTHSEAFWEVTLRFSYLPIYKTHLYWIIGLFRFPVGPPSFWFVGLIPCASTTPYNLNTAHVVYCFTPFCNLTVSTFSS